MPVRFEDELKVSGNDVIAAGPLTPGEQIKQLCVWVYQKIDGNDAAATEMTTSPTGQGKLEISPDGSRWTFPVTRVSDTEFRPPETGFAVAVALMSVNGRQRVVWWGQPVNLKP